MPPKLRELMAELEQAGFVRSPGKGSHRKFTRGTQVVILSGQPGDDAKRYQERDVQRAIEESP